SSARHQLVDQLVISSSISSSSARRSARLVRTSIRPRPAATFTSWGLDRLLADIAAVCPNAGQNIACDREIRCELFSARNDRFWVVLSEVRTKGQISAT